MTTHHNLFFLLFLLFFFNVLLRVYQFCVGRFARAATSGNDYFILLIITDGIITDMPQTSEAIVNVRFTRLSPFFCLQAIESE
jgi:hypothetical protein